MTHRDLSLTGWITNKTHGAKHPAPVILSPTMYAAAERAGFDMRFFAVNQPMPTHGEVMRMTHGMPTSAQMRAEINRKIAAGEPLGASHVSEIKPGTFIAGTLVKPDLYAYTPRPARKHLDERQCGGKEIGCLYNQGRCVACPRDD